MIYITADDFGMNESCSLAIAAAFREGIVNFTSMAANGEYFDEALDIALREGFSDKIGIHLNLTEGAPLSVGSEALTDFVTGGRFNKSYSWDTALTEEEQELVYSELEAQLKRLTSSGIKPTHADSHHYIHNAPFIAPVAERLCREYGIRRLRLMPDRGTPNSEAPAYKDRLRAEGFVTAERFLRLRDVRGRDIPDGTELLVHPDLDRDGRLIDRLGMMDGYPFGERLL